jgi:predicted  nucleic acid-binding Zn-ribbon protein
MSLACDILERVKSVDDKDAYFETTCTHCGNIEKYSHFGEWSSSRCNKCASIKFGLRTWKHIFPIARGGTCTKCGGGTTYPEGDHPYGYVCKGCGKRYYKKKDESKAKVKSAVVSVRNGMHRAHIEWDDGDVSATVDTSSAKVHDWLHEKGVPKHKITYDKSVQYKPDSGKYETN